MGAPVLDPTSTADRLAAAGERVTRQRLLVAAAFGSTRLLDNLDVPPPA